MILIIPLFNWFWFLVGWCGAAVCFTVLYAFLSWFQHRHKPEESQL